MTKVAELNPGMIKGVRTDPFALLTVILKVVYVAFRKDQNFPPSDVATVAGSPIALNAELVRWKYRFESTTVTICDVAADSTTVSADDPPPPPATATGGVTDIPM